jgi:hypothetical protein
MCNHSVRHYPVVHECEEGALRLVLVDPCV